MDIKSTHEYNDLTEQFSQAPTGISIDLSQEEFDFLFHAVSEYRMNYLSGTAYDWVPENPGKRFTFNQAKETYESFMEFSNGI